MILQPTPCYNCIVLPICKTKISCISNSRIWEDVIHLSMECDILERYITPNNHYTYNIYKRRLAVHYLSGRDFQGNQDGFVLERADDLYHAANIENPHKNRRPKWKKV